MKGTFKVIWDGDGYNIYSEVYAVDMTRDRFLIVNDCGWFKWVPTNECRIDKEDKE
jgi:hypothetical protein